MENNDIMLAGQNAKPLHQVRNKNLLEEQINNLKLLLEENGLQNVIIRLQIFAENKDNQKNKLSSVEFTDKGSMLYYTEWF